MAVVLRDAGHARSLASRPRAQTLDLSASTLRPTAAGNRDPRTRAAPRTREPALGLSADRRHEIFRTEGLQIIRTPFRAPKANAVAERFVRTVRSECLDWLLISGRRQLERTLRTFIDHYNTHRPHRALGLTPPHKDRPPLHLAYTDTEKRVRRRDRLGGLIHEYRMAA
jgi:transposase InsO family protein